MWSWSGSGSRRSPSRAVPCLICSRHPADLQLTCINWTTTYLGHAIDDSPEPVPDEDPTERPRHWCPGSWSLAVPQQLGREGPSRWPGKGRGGRGDVKEQRIARQVGGRHSSDQGLYPLLVKTGDAACATDPASWIGR